MKRVFLVSALALAAGAFFATVAAPSTPAPPKGAARPAPAKSTGDAAPDVRPPKKAAAPAQPGEPAAPNQPGKGTPADKPAEPSTTEIFAKECELDNPSHIGIFTGDVIVVNPQFKMNCDKLFAYIRHDEPKDPSENASEKTPASQTASEKTPKTGAPGATPAPAGTSRNPKPTHPVEGNQKASATPQPKAATPVPTAPNSDSEKGAGSGTAKGGSGKAAVAAAEAAKDAAADQKAGGLQKAIAEGNVVINQDKTDANGNVEHDVAHAKKALYDTDTGDVTLYGKPDVQQGGNHVIALDETTIIILNRSGHMTVHGPHKVVLENSGSTAPDSKNPNAR